MVKIGFMGMTKFCIFDKVKVDILSVLFVNLKMGALKLPLLTIETRSI
jgi:hypothetical protein